MNTADIMPLFIYLLMAALCLESMAQKDNVLQPQGDVTATEGHTVTLECQYNSSLGNPSLFWYKQDGNNSPRFILSRFKGDEGNTPEESKERFSSTLDSAKRSVPLKIKNLQLSDSAVYYCALTQSGSRKILFGSGTQLYVQTKEDVEPSFYKLNDDKNNRTACLATGFTRYDSLKNETLFKGTEAVRAKEDDGSEPVYSQVAFFNGNASDTCVEAGSGGCGGSLDPDPMVNLVSLTVVVLRLIFIKTVIFNVLMTFRLWISQ